MPLAQLLYPAPTPNGFSEWVFHNYQHHLSILSALSAKFNTNFVEYQIWPDPVGGEAFSVWLEAHANQHTDMCSALGIISNDLSAVDFNDAGARDNWLYLHFTEHLAVAQSLLLTT